MKKDIAEAFGLTGRERDRSEPGPKNERGGSCPFPECDSPPSPHCNCKFCEEHHWMSVPWQVLDHIELGERTIGSVNQSSLASILQLVASVEVGEDNSLQTRMIMTVLDVVQESVVTTEEAKKLLVLVHKRFGDLFDESYWED